MDVFLPHDFPRPVKFTPDQHKRIAAAFDGPRGQTRKGSMLEIVVSTAAGFFLSLAIGHWLFPVMFHTTVSYETNILITSIFTAASIVRGYVMRRIFNWLHMRG